MTYEELLKKMEAWLIVMPILGEQKVYGISITPDGKVKFTLDVSIIEIPIT